MRIAPRHYARLGRLAAAALVAAGVATSSAVGSTSHTQRDTRSASCPEVNFAPNSDDIAFNIRTHGISCAAGHPVVEAASADRLRPGPNRAYRSGAFACRGTFVKPVGKWYEHYVCRSSHGRVEFDRG